MPPLPRLVIETVPPPLLAPIPDATSEPLTLLPELAPIVNGDELFRVRLMVPPAPTPVPATLRVLVMSMLPAAVKLNVPPIPEVVVTVADAGVKRMLLAD